MDVLPSTADAKSPPLPPLLLHRDPRQHRKPSLGFSAYNIAKLQIQVASPAAQPPEDSASEMVF